MHLMVRNGRDAREQRCVGATLVPQHVYGTWSSLDGSPYLNGVGAGVGFPDSSAGKEYGCSVGDLGSLPGLGRSPGEGNGWLPTPVFRPGEFHGLYSPWGH